MTRIVYCDDSQPGITRQKVLRLEADRKRITDRDEIGRLNGVGQLRVGSESFAKANKSFARRSPFPARRAISIVTNAV